MWCLNLDVCPKRDGFTQRVTGFSWIQIIVPISDVVVWFGQVQPTCWTLNWTSEDRFIHFAGGREEKKLSRNCADDEAEELAPVCEADGMVALSSTSLYQWMSVASLRDPSSATVHWSDMLKIIGCVERTSVNVYTFSQTFYKTPWNHYFQKI